MIDSKKDKYRKQIDLENTVTPSDFRLTRHRRILLFSLVTFILIALINAYAKEGSERLAVFGNSDLYKFWLSGQRLKAGESMYWAAPIIRANESNCSETDQFSVDITASSDIQSIAFDQCLHPNLNPPVFGFISLALAFFSPTGAWWIWVAASTMAALVALFLVASTLTTKPHDRTLLTILGFTALLLYFPTFAAYSLGQVTFLLFLPLVASWLAFRRDRDFAAGVWIGLAISLKPFFGLFFLLFLAGRFWRAAAGCVFICLVALVGGAWLTGVESYMEYMKILGDVGWLSASWNGSIAGYFDRIDENITASLALYLDWPLRLLKISLVLIVSSTLLGGLLITKNLGREAGADIIFGLAVPAMLLISPLGWLYYYPFLFLTFFVIFIRSAQLKHALRHKLMVLVAIALTAIPTPLLPGYDMSSPTEWFWDAGRYTYALLISFGIVAYVAMENTRSRLSFQAACKCSPQNY